MSRSVAAFLAVVKFYSSTNRLFKLIKLFFTSNSTELCQIIDKAVALYI